jgi:regulatory protein
VTAARRAPATRGAARKTSLLVRAVRLLARRDHSRAELKAKLRHGSAEGDAAADIERVLDRLERDHLLSDERFAGALTRARASRFGDSRIRHELKRSGVSGLLVDGAVAALKGTELERAHALWARRFGALPRDAAERGRQARFLQARGFSTETIRRVLRGLPGEDD